MAAAVPKLRRGPSPFPGSKSLPLFPRARRRVTPKAISAALILRRSIVRREHAQELQKPFHTDPLRERAAARFYVGDGDDRSCNLHRSASFSPAHGFIGWFEVATVAR